MKLSILKFASALMLVTTIVVSAPTAHAGWGSLGGSFGGGSFGGGSWGGGSHGSSGGYAVSYGSSGGSSGFASGGSSGFASGGSHGWGGRRFTPIRSLLSHIHQKHSRRAAFGSHGSHGSSGYSVSYGSGGHGSSGYSVSYGSSGFGSSGYGVSHSGGSFGGVSYGSVGSTISYDAGVSYGSAGSPVYSQGFSGGHVSDGGAIFYGAASSSIPTNLITTSQVAGGDAVHLTVNVPANAQIFVNGKPTTSTGAVREFVSRGLISGNSYKFDVRAELEAADGQTLTESKTIILTAGSQQHLQFAFADSNAPVETALTLNVPEGAKVVLAGNETKATGSQRVFRSSHLQLGQAWDDYVVEVEVDGEVKKQSIRLIGGDNLELTFDFDPQAVSHVATKPLN